MPWYAQPEWWLFILGIPTLFIIGWQSFETRRAAIGAKKAVDASLVQIRTMKDRERARLSIYAVFTPLIATKSETVTPDFPLKITLLIINDGNSFAFNVRAEGHYNIDKLIDGPEVSISDESLDWYNLAIPATIRSIGRASQTEIIVTHMADTRKKFFQPIDTETANALRRGDLSLMIAGEISYEDIFGDRHKTPFFYLWVVGGDRGIGGWGAESGWVNLSGEST